MDTGELIEKLENLAVPNVENDGHRKDLRRTLLYAYQTSNSKAGLGIIRHFSPAARFLTGSGLGAAFIIAVLVIGTHPPTPSGTIDESKVIAAVMDSPAIKAALLDDIAGVKVSGILETGTKVTITTSKGYTYTALVNAQGQVIAINPDRPRLAYTFYAPLTLNLGAAYYDSIPIALTDEEKEKTIKVALTTDPTRSMFENGATITTMGLAYAKTTVAFDLDQLIWTAIVHEKLTQILVQYDGQQWLYFVDFANGEVFESIEVFCQYRGIPHPDPKSSAEPAISIEIQPNP